MKKIWVVVADEAIARILEWPEVGSELEPVEELTDADAHAKNAELRRDAAGRRAGSGARGLSPGANATASAGLDQSHLEAGDFARRVAAHLKQALQQGRFDELRIVAAPRFLGLLRRSLDKEVTRLVVEEFDKDLVHLANSEITLRVFPSPKVSGDTRNPRP